MRSPLAWQEKTSRFPHRPTSSPRRIAPWSVHIAPRTARAASPVVPLDGVRGAPPVDVPPSPVPRRRALPTARGGSPPPVGAPHRPWGLPTAARLFKHASYGRLPTYVRAPNPSTQKQPESTVHEQSRLCSCRSVRFVARCHAHRFDDASHPQYGLR